MALTQEAASAIYRAAVAPLANGKRQSRRDAMSIAFIELEPPKLLPRGT